MKPEKRRARHELLSTPIFALVVAACAASTAGAQTVESEPPAVARARAKLDVLLAKVDDRSVQALEDLTHRRAERRRAGPEHLGLFEVAAAGPGLGALLSDPDDAVRVAASRALWPLGKPAAEAARAQLEQALAGDPVGGVRINAAGALARLGAAKEQLVSSLRPVLQDRSR